MGGSAHTVKRNTEFLVVTSNEIGLEVNADKATYMVISRDQNAGRSLSIKIVNSSFERVEFSDKWEKILANQNSIQEEIKNRLNSRNICYHSVQNLLASGFLSKKIKIKIYRTIILPLVLYGFATWSLTLSEECRRRVYGIRVLGRIFGPKRDEVTGE